MTTDLMIRLPEGGDGFTLTILFLLDDGHVARARRKEFPGRFQARQLQGYTADWASPTWADCDDEQLGEIRRVRSSQEKKTI